MDADGIPADSIITFPDGLPGLGELRRFVLQRPDDCAPIVLLQSVENELVSLPLIPAASVRADYRLEVDDDDLRRLEAKRAAELTALVVLVLAGGSGVATCNLFAPIVVNPQARLGRQVLQTGSDYPSSCPLTGE